MNNSPATINGEALLNIAEAINHQQNGTPRAAQVQRVADELRQLLRDELFGGQFRRAFDLIDELTDSAQQEGFEQGFCICLQLEKARNDLRAKYGFKTPCKASNG